MTIDYRRYGGSSRKAWNHRVGINIRLRRHKSLGKPTQEDVMDALQHMLDTGGDVPRGWQFAAIHWGRPEEATETWRSGRIEDFHRFRDVIEHQIDNLRIEIVRPER